MTTKARILERHFLLDYEGIQITGLALSDLPKTKKESPAPCETSRDFIAPTVATSTAQDGTGLALFGTVVTQNKGKTELRLLELAEPVQGCRYMVGVFNGEEPDNNIGGLFLELEADARKYFDERKRNSAEIIRQLQYKPPPSKEEIELKNRIAQIKELARKYGGNHIKKLAEAEAELRELQAAQARAKEPTPDEIAWQAAVQKLVENLFPEAWQVGRAWDFNAPDMQERWRKAFNLDATRLGLGRTYATGPLTNEDIQSLARAIEAKSPLKPDQLEAVLNWLAKGFCTMPEREWTAQIPDASKALGKIVQKDFGLKSQITGRPTRK